MPGEGPSAMMANYHAAFGLGENWLSTQCWLFLLAMYCSQKAYESRRTHHLSYYTGIGIEITPEVEAAFPFDPEAVYSCKLLNRGARVMNLGKTEKSKSSSLEHIQPLEKIDRSSLGIRFSLRSEMQLSLES